MVTSQCARASHVAADIVVLPLTSERWRDIERLFEDCGTTRRCWCMYWRIGARYRTCASSANRSAFARVVADGPPPGLLAYSNGEPVGWCQIGPRATLPAMARAWRLRTADEAPVWAISCFYVRKDCRRRRIATRLTEAAVLYARGEGAPAIEAYPIDRATSSSASSTGFVSTFARLGFRQVASPSRERSIMRLTVTGTR